MSRQQIRAGGAVVEIGLRSRIQQDAKNVERDLSNIGKRVGALGAIIGGMGAGMSAPFALAAKTFASFDDAMRMVGAVSQSTTAQLAAMTEVAKELGRTTSFTAIDVAGLMGELGKAGFKPDQIIAMTGAVLDLARATGTDATLASGIMAATIRQFGMEAGDAARVADVLTAAANMTFNSVEQLGEALSYAGPVAADFNMSIEETTAILGTLGNVGIQASSAGTTLRRLLTITGAEAERLQEIFGVSFLDAAGNARPLVDTLGEVSKATNGLGTAARSAKFNEAFGLLGITGASAIGKVSAETKVLYEALLNAEGQAKRTSTQMDAGLGGSFRMLTSGVEGVVNAMGEAFGTTLQTVTDKLTQATVPLTAFIENNKEMVTAVALSSGALVGIGGSLIGVGLGLKLASVAVGGFSSVMTIAGVGVTLATGAFNAFGAVTSMVATGLAVSTGAASTTVLALSGSMAAATATGGTFAAVGALVSASWGGVAATVAAAWAAIIGPAAPFLAVAAVIVGTVTALGAAATYAGLKAVDFSAGLDIAKQTLQDLMAIAKLSGGVILDAFAAGDYETAARAAWVGVKLAFLEGFESLVAGFRWLYEQAWNFTSAFFSKMLSILKLVVAAINDPIGALPGLVLELSNIATKGVSFGFSTDTTMAKAGLAKELVALQAELDRKKAARDGAVGPDGKPRVAAPGSPAAAPIAEAKLSKAQIEAERAKIAAAEKFGDITKEEADKQRARLDAMESTSTAVTDAYERETKALQEQIIALREGEEAAERFRLKKDGLNDEQIKAIMLLQKEKQGLETDDKLKTQRAEARAAAIGKQGDELVRRGGSPATVFKREMEQIAKDLKAGLLTPEVAESARGDARSRLDDRQADLQEQGRRLVEAMRTPQEKLTAELANIGRLQKAGVIDGLTAARAQEKARRESLEGQFKGVDDLTNRLGPSGSFSAQGAAIIAARGQRPDKKELIEIAKNTREMAKQNRKDRIARFGP